MFGTTTNTYYSSVFVVKPDIDWSGGFQYQLRGQHLFTPDYTAVDSRVKHISLSTWSSYIMDHISCDVPKKASGGEGVVPLVTCRSKHRAV